MVKIFLIPQKEISAYLEDLCCVCELPHIAESEDGHHLLARNQRVQVAPTAHVVRNDLCPRIAIPYRHQTAHTAHSIFKTQ